MVLKMLKDYGLNFLEDSTRFILSEVYERDFPFVQAQEERWDRFFCNVASPILMKNFMKLKIEWGGLYDDMTPTDFSSLKKNPAYLNILRTTQEFVVQRLKWQRQINKSLIILHRRLGNEIYD